MKKNEERRKKAGRGKENMCIKNRARGNAQTKLKPNPNMMTEKNTNNWHKPSNKYSLITWLLALASSAAFWACAEASATRCARFALKCAYGNNYHAKAKTKKMNCDIKKWRQMTVNNEKESIETPSPCASAIKNERRNQCIFSIPWWFRRWRWACCAWPPCPPETPHSSPPD